MLRIFLLLLTIAGNALAAANVQSEFLAAAKAQIGVTLKYDPSYQKIPYPNGDVPIDRGVCTDVVIRAYRKLGIDLQILVHKDMLSAWDKYPNLWRLKKPDTHIDHRRVPNLMTFFKRHGETLAIGNDHNSFQPGNIVTWRLSSGVPHIGIVSDQYSASGVPLIIHNIGAGTQIEDILFGHTITGHFRYFPTN